MFNCVCVVCSGFQMMRLNVCVLQTPSAAVDVFVATQVRLDVPGVVNLRNLVAALLGRDACCMSGTSLDSQLTTVSTILAASDSSTIPADVLSAVETVRSFQQTMTLKIYAAINFLPQGGLLRQT